MAYCARIVNHRSGETRRFPNFEIANSYARSRCSKAGGIWQIETIDDGRNGMTIARVSLGADDRIWTDVLQTERPLL